MGRDFIHIEKPPGETPAACGACDWRGRADGLSPLHGATILTAGDPSPAGRCPACESLAYLNRPEDRRGDRAAEMERLLRAIVDDQVSLNAFRATIDRVRAMLAEIDGEDAR